ncbi:tetratricopeptide repeat protein [Streptomyces sp. IBSNAI002]|uniref:tetratricopeptide repeat protein n=1 Tax=Streptomyces sp. IBSNAI002 TaxID=3457500 RepID=UPI003FCF2563
MHRETRTPGRSRRRLLAIAITLALGTAMFAAGAVLIEPANPGPPETTPSTLRDTRPAGTVQALTARLERLPRDFDAWSALGMAHIEQARTTTDPAAYTRAEQAFRRSLALQPQGNTGAETGMAALAAARHDFTTARTWANKAITSDPYNPAAYGVLADAHTQLGHYQDAEQAVQKMNDLRPDAASLARASYTFELRGNTKRAAELMRRSLTAAATDSERAFAHTCLSQLALEDGDAQRTLNEAEQGLRATPGDAALLDARARANAALGRTDQALADWQRAANTVPLPHVVLALGEMYERLGKQPQADAQYALLKAQDTLRASAGSPPDTDAVLFEADHQSPARAVAMAEEALRGRPFLAVHDAYAWALHRAGRDREALTHADKALALGTRQALWSYHRAAIHHALGDDTAAREDLENALGRAPALHPLHAGHARALLERIGPRP